jgi:transposase
MIELVKKNTMSYLEQYHLLRSNSESGFAADKKMLGWGIAQKREDRINCAQFCTGLWYNLFNLATATKSSMSQRVLSHALLSDKT